MIARLRSLPRVAVVLGVIAAVGVGALALGWPDGGDGGTRLVPRGTPAGAAGLSAGATQAPPVPDRFRYSAKNEDELARRAAEGLAHPLYAFSPGGIVASAKRTARYRGAVEAAAQRIDLDPDVLEGMVLLESAGRPDAIAGTTKGALTGAVGLTQILDETGRNLLRMRIDANASGKLTRRLTRERRRGRRREVAKIIAKRMTVDERFDPVKALAATGRYLQFARGRFGRDDLAVVSYHMGVGNLGDVVRAFAGVRRGTDIKGLVADDKLSYAKLYFDSSPARHGEAWTTLSGFGDDSLNYWWKVRAAEQIMRTYRTDPGALQREAGLQTAKASAEEVLHPKDDTDAFADPSAVRDAFDRGDVIAFPPVAARIGFRVDAQMGEEAPRLNRSRTLYRGLRPEAMAMLVYIARQTRALSGSPGRLAISSSVRDRDYQKLLVADNIEATRKYSLHTTGYTFDALRRYRSKRQSLAFQFVLDRLTALNLIAWVREPAAIHITVSSDAGAFEGLLGPLRRVPASG